MESGLLIAGVRVGNESWDHHVTQRHSQDAG